MLLRSSSTPVLGSLISSFSESPSNHLHHHQSDLTPNHTPHHSYSKLSYSHGGSQNLTKISHTCNSPIVSELNNGIKLASHGFRRAQSEGNLEGLANTSNEIDEFSLSKPPKMFIRKPHNPILEPIQSFSRKIHEYDDSDEEDEDEYECEDDDEVGYISRQYNLGNNVVKEEMSSVSQYSKVEVVDGRVEMFLARGLGVAEIGCLDDGIGGPYGGYSGGGGGFRPVTFDDRDGGDSQGLHIEEHYKRMLEENPGNSLFLRNYAQFLYQTKKDLKGAEGYYSRAILADPTDGDILSQYAKLVWELHHDADRAESYFQRAVQAASSDSHIHAAYANFLWEIEDEEENIDIQESPLIRTIAMASATA